MWAHMTERKSANDDLEQRCWAAVERVLARHGWRLLEREEYVQRVVACVRSGEVADPRQAAMHVYCRCLYTACFGSEGRERQEIGFVELQRYLYELSFRGAADLPADLRWEAVNETLLRIWQKLPSYYKPGAFLAIAALELRNVLRPWWSRPLDPLSIDSFHDQPTTHIDDDPLAHALNGELRQRVIDYFEEALRRHPRAKQQLEAVWLKYIAGLDDETISTYLRKPVASIHVLRSRGLSQLRTEPGWQGLANELGL